MSKIYKKQVLAEWQTMNDLALRRFGDQHGLAEEAVLFAMDGLAANDWARVRQFRGGATFKSFLKILVVRLYEDFARKKFGRLHPPQWIKTLGGNWLRMFIALCQQRMKIGDAVEIVQQQRIAKISAPAELEDIGFEILGRIPQCGKHQWVEEELPEEGVADARGTGVEYLENNEQRTILSLLFQQVVGTSASGDETLSQLDMGKVVQKFNELRFNLTAEEKLLLRLCFQEGLDVTAAGRALSLNRFQAHGRMKRLLDRLKKEFDRVGLSSELQLLIKD
nr:hypothetical protein [uncultured Desulfobulbus sp.]